VTLSLRRPTEAEFGEWVERSVAAYAQDEIAAGRVSPEQAVARARESYVGLLPDGPDTAGAVVGRLDDDEDAVGWLWVARKAEGPPDLAWVYDIEIDESHRGRGLGRQAMLLAEDLARQLGATALGLNVFGGNAVARGLYASLGYTETAVQLRKPL
jgi:ribosomal protein S18 acetylase RimI-like enzyme